MEAGKETVDVGKAVAIQPQDLEARCAVESASFQLFQLIAGQIESNQITQSGEGFLGHRADVIVGQVEAVELLPGGRQVGGPSDPVRRQVERLEQRQLTDGFRNNLQAVARQVEIA